MTRHPHNWNRERYREEYGQFGWPRWPGGRIYGMKRGPWRAVRNGTMVVSEDSQFHPSNMRRRHG